MSSEPPSVGTHPRFRPSVSLPHDRKGSLKVGGLLGSDDPTVKAFYANSADLMSEDEELVDEIEGSDGQTYLTGENAHVYSISNNVWKTGSITQITADGEATVVYSGMKKIIDLTDPQLVDYFRPGSVPLPRADESNPLQNGHSGDDPRNSLGGFDFGAMEEEPDEDDDVLAGLFGAGDEDLDPESMGMLGSVGDGSAEKSAPFNAEEVAELKEMVKDQLDIGYQYEEIKEDLQAQGIKDDLIDYVLKDMIEKPTSDSDLHTNYFVMDGRGEDQMREDSESDSPTDLDPPGDDGLSLDGAFDPPAQAPPLGHDRNVSTIVSDLTNVHPSLRQNSKPLGNTLDDASSPLWEDGSSPVDHLSAPSSQGSSHLRDQSVIISDSSAVHPALRGMHDRNESVAVTDADAIHPVLQQAQTPDDLSMITEETPTSRKKHMGFPDMQNRPSQDLDIRHLLDDDAFGETVVGRPEQPKREIHGRTHSAAIRALDQHEIKKSPMGSPREGGMLPLTEEADEEADIDFGDLERSPSDLLRSSQDFAGVDATRKFLEQQMELEQENQFDDELGSDYDMPNDGGHVPASSGRPNTQAPAFEHLPKLENLVERRRESRVLVLKVILLGDSLVGKTSIIRAFVDESFAESYQCTIQPSLFTKPVTLDNGQQVNLQIWDTAGQERFRSMNSSYYRGAHAVIFTYDITNPQTFKSLEYWLQNFNDFGSHSGQQPFPFLLLGNKVDLAEERSVSSDQAVAWCRKHKAAYFETSAKVNVGLDRTFEYIAERAVSYQYTLNQQDPSSMGLVSGGRVTLRSDGAVNVTTTYLDQFKQWGFETIESLRGCCNM